MEALNERRVNNMLSVIEARVVVPGSGVEEEEEEEEESFVTACPRGQVRTRSSEERRRRRNRLNLSRFIITISLMKVTCGLLLSAHAKQEPNQVLNKNQNQNQNQNQNEPQEKVVEAIRPIQDSRFAETVPAAVRRSPEESSSQHNESPELANSISSARVEGKPLIENRPKRVRRSIKPFYNQELADTTKVVAESIMAGSDLRHASLNSRHLSGSSLNYQRGQSNQEVASIPGGNCSSSVAGATFHAEHLGELEPEIGSEAAKIRQLLSRFYRVESSLAANARRTKERVGDQLAAPAGFGAQQQDKLLELPRPSNVSVLIISWYPPILKLSWSLNELGESDAKRLNFYENSSETANNEQKQRTSSGGDLLDEFDLELAIEDETQGRGRDRGRGRERGRNEPERRKGNEENNNVASGNDDSQQEEVSGADVELLRELRQRRNLVRKSLTCFQVTYNIINSRFKIIEEYPPYLRSIMLERLLPATEYSLHVVAVYLNRYRLFSERVQFVSPTDNESRRFKEGTYRPIHRYPDEPKPRHLRYGLGQVRSEELTIVAIALLFWIATICLFFNKWGKIRMLEPYQPAYRESSSTTFAVHHHPSMHNLAPNCSTGSGSNGTGSGALAGIGAKMSSLCGVEPANSPGTIQPPSTPVQAQVQVPVQQQNIQRQTEAAIVGAPVTSASTAGVERASRMSGPNVAGLSSTPVCPLELEQRSMDTATVFGRKLSRGLLLRGRKRFETVADEPLVPIKQRTNDELNYLFQTKAQALVRATALWSKQQQEKLRQQQYCTRLTEGELTQNQDDEFEILRRTSQVSSMLRQRHYTAQQNMSSTGSNLIGTTLCQVAPTSVTSSTQAAATRPLDSIAQEVTPDQEESPMRKSVARRDQRNQSLKYHRQSRALDYSTSARGVTCSLDAQQQQKSGSHAQLDQAARGGDGDVWTSKAQQCEEGAALSNTNKLRRMMFLSKTHQHHHIATSNSSSLLNNASLGANSSNGGRRASSQLVGSASMRLNSASLDSSGPMRSSQRSAEPTEEEEAGRAPVESGSASREQQQSRQHLCSSLPDVDAQGRNGKVDENKEREELDKKAAERQAVPPCRITLEASPDEQKPVEHHILIEPPSPPHKRVARGGGDLLVESDLSQVKPAERDQSGNSSSGELVRDQAKAGTDETLAELVVAEQQQSRRRSAAQQSEPTQVQSLSQIFQEPQRQRRSWQDLRPDNGSEPTATVTGGEPSFGSSLSRKSEVERERRFQPEICFQEAAFSRPWSGSAQPEGPIPSQAQAQAQPQPQPSEDSSRSRRGLLSADEKKQTSKKSEDAFAKLASYTSRAATFHAQAHSLSQASVQLLSQGGDYLRHQSFCSGVGAAPSSAGLAMQSGRRSVNQRIHLATTYSCGSGTSQAALGALRAPLLFEQTADSSEDAETCALGMGGDEGGGGRARVSSVFAGSSYSRAHRDSFAMLRALSQKKSKSAEDVAYLSSLVLQIWARDRNPLLESASQQQLSLTQRRQSGSHERARANQRRPKSSLNVSHL